MNEKQQFLNLLKQKQQTFNTLSLEEYHSLLFFLNKLIIEGETDSDILDQIIQLINTICKEQESNKRFPCECNAPVRENINSTNERIPDRIRVLISKNFIM